jgi:hypothetical protein
MQIDLKWKTALERMFGNLVRVKQQEVLKKAEGRRWRTQREREGAAERGWRQPPATAQAALYQAMGWGGDDGQSWKWNLESRDDDGRDWTS